MPRYDVICPDGHQAERVARWDDRAIPCATCGAPTERIWVQSAAVIPDTLPGGAQWIENLDTAPVWVESKSQLRREAAARGLRWDPKRTRGTPPNPEADQRGRFNGGAYPTYRT